MNCNKYVSSFVLLFFEGKIITDELFLDYIRLPSFYIVCPVFPFPTFPILFLLTVFLLYL